MRAKRLFAAVKAAAIATALLATAAVPTMWGPIALAAGPPPGSWVRQPSCAAAPRPGMTACQIARAAPSPALRALDARVRATAGTGTPIGYGPSQLQAAYQLPSTSAGNLQTVAVVAPYDDPNAAADLAIYRQQYGLNPCTASDGCFTKAYQDREPNPPGPNPTWALATSAQLDAISAVCPNCHILLVEVNSPAITDVVEGMTTAVGLGAQVVTIGVSEPEISSDIYYDVHYFANAEGVAVTAAAGDNGYQTADSPLGYPAASQYVTAVGGTTLKPSGTSNCTTAQAGSRGWCESVWNDLTSTTNPMGTESGCSEYDTQPSWQKNYGVTGCSGMRVSVDVAADADPATGIAVYDSGQGGWQATGTGGTAVAAAIVAGVYALAGTPAGGTYPAEYPYERPGALNDITTGNNVTSGQTCYPKFLCEAAAGYDGPSGLGSPRGTLSFTAAGSQTGSLYNGTNDMCADDLTGGSSNGNIVDIWHCDEGVNSQSWTTEADGTIRINGRCLALVTPATGSGTKIQLWQCISGDGNQQWQPQANGEIVNVATGLCLDNYGGGTSNGTQLVLWSCNGKPDEQWVLPYPQPYAQDRIESAYPAPTTLCADDLLGGSNNGNVVDIWKCNDGSSGTSPPQSWTIESDGTIRIDGSCLDAKQFGLTSPTLVQLWQCLGGTNQQWRVLSDGAIQGLESGLCLDENGTTANGTQLTIKKCANEAEQTWLPTTYQNNFPTTSRNKL